MVQRIIFTATLALAFIGEVSATNQYTLVDDYAGTNFFDMFDFYTGADPTTGFVSYTSKEVAENANSELGVELTKVENGQAYMGVDYVNVVTTGRPSVRIQSKETYTHGLIIADLAHMPASICGTWPAFWTVNSTNYPQYGEIDILENINEKTVSLQTLHTQDGCYISGNQYSSQLQDNVTSYNCDDTATSSIFGAQDATSACSGTNTDPNSYGTPFNSNGGGVYAMQWTSDVIRMWNFGPDAIPADITAGTPDPSTWTLPSFTTEGGVCNIDELFANHKIVFDTTFCGGYAGQTGFWEETTCYDADKFPTCDSYVGANPAAYKEAYWLINSVKVYQNDTLAATSAASTSSTSALVASTSTQISTTASPVISSTARAESLLSIATSVASSIASVVAASSSSSASCVSIGVLLSGQIACPASSLEVSSTTSIIASVSSVATVVPITTQVEASSTAIIIASVSSLQVSSVASVAPSGSSIASAMTTISVPHSHTTSTIYGTNTRTDEVGSVITETIILSTTICPITAAEGEASSTAIISSSISSVQASSVASAMTTISVPHSHTTSTIYGTNTRTDEVGSVITETIILSTTICPITAAEGEASSTAIISSSISSVQASSVASAMTTISVPHSHTTSTIYGTNTRTDEVGSVVTETIILSTTICPITAVEGEATPSPSSVNADSTTTIQSTLTSIQLASTIYSTVTLSGGASAASSTLSLVLSLSATTLATTQISEAAYAWSTVTNEGASTVVDIGSSTASLISIPTVSVSSEIEGAIPSSTAISSISLSCETTSVSSAACVASGALVSGETASPESPAKAINTNTAISAQPSTASSADAPVVLSTATVIPMQSVAVQATTTAEILSIPQPSSALAQPETAIPIIFTPTYATTSFVTQPTSASTYNSTSSQTSTSSNVSVTGTGILIDTATLSSTETFTFAMPSVYSATGTSDSSAVTAYPLLESGVGRVNVRGSLIIAVGAIILGLVL
ncbi:glycoside hydrolase family 16 protein [Sclerotinia borealis F-4128]|uniref:Glycoside hydrolase family 16 protein n=1 Tax=Sclerotinia borealis (strain F-4128) TaxID=1432307 RepID=W9CIP4_SCLBF|nr:glycoside hydrolase family 16 protein [Sclerotinia borealis F-4128]